MKWKHNWVLICLWSSSQSTDKSRTRPLLTASVRDGNRISVCCKWRNFFFFFKEKLWSHKYVCINMESCVSLFLQFSFLLCWLWVALKKTQWAQLQDSAFLQPINKCWSGKAQVLLSSSLSSLWCVQAGACACFSLALACVSFELLKEPSGPSRGTKTRA